MLSPSDSRPMSASPPKDRRETEVKIVSVGGVERGFLIKVGAVLCAGALAFGAAAQDVDGSNLEEMSLEDLLNMKIETSIASKTEESLLAASGTVYVVTEEEIRRYGWRGLKEI